MKRGLGSEGTRKLVKTMKEKVSGVALRTTLIVGYPGETEEDFQNTYNLVKEAGFDSAYIFKYSPRPHTQAEALTDDVPAQEKQRRHRIILDLQKSISKSKRKNE